MSKTWYGLLLTALLTLVGCQEPIKIDFARDPRVLSGQWVGELLQIGKPYSNLSVDSTGQHLVALKGQTVVWLDAHTGQELRQANLPTDVTYSYATKLLVDGSANVWLIQDHRLLHWDASGMALPPWNISVAAVSRDASRLISRDGPNSFTLWDLKNQQKIRGFSLPDDFPMNNTGERYWGAISPDLQILTFGKFQRSGLAIWAEVPLYNLDGQRIQTLIEHRGFLETSEFGVGGIYFSSDGSRVMAYIYSHGLRVWRVGDGFLEHSMTSPNSYPEVLELGPEGKTVVFFESATPAGSGVIPTYTLHWWDASRGFYAQQTVQDVWRDAVSSNRVALSNQVWLATGYGLLTQVSPTGMVWRHEPVKIPLEFNLKATYETSHQYTFTGTAQLGSTPYSVEGKGYSGADLIQSAPPPMLGYQAILQDAQGGKQYITGYTKAERNPPQNFYYPLYLTNVPPGISAPPLTDTGTGIGELKRK